ncbi:hypothetical protein ER57_07880 [Smithella sp. SCADC]|nr:hypothetical protein ER57_07880 [Smithella sp. SCADC]
MCKYMRSLGYINLMGPPLGLFDLRRDKARVSPTKNDPEPNGKKHPKQSHAPKVPRSPLGQYLCIARNTKFDFGPMEKSGRKIWKRF